MNILFLTENFPPELNAAATRVYERACYWVNWGHQVTVVTQVPNFPVGKIFPGYQHKWYQTELMDGIRVVRVKTFISRNEGVLRRILDFASFMVSGCLGGLRQKRPDVVIATSPQFFTAVAGWVLARMRRVPFVFELSDLWPASIAAVGALRNGPILKSVEQLELFLYRQADMVVSLTESFKDDLVRREIPAEKIEVIINGVDLLRYAPQPKARHILSRYGLKDRFCVGYLGTHGMAHALENILHSAERLRDRSSDIHFLFVGDGATKQHLVARAEQMGLSNVTFVPLQPKHLIADFWSVCDVALIHLKDDDLFKTVIPSKIFEAMGMGLPILLASPEGEASEIIQRERAGLWVPAEKPDALCEAVLSLRRDERLRGRLAQNSLKAAPGYSRQRQAEYMIDALDRVVQKRKRREPGRRA